MKYGYFNDEKKEYVITNPHTPVKWINYIGGLSFGGFVDQLGGSVICKGDPAVNRIVKYIPQLPDSSFNGETTYIRLKTPNGVKIFSPFFVPTLDKYDLYECHVGLGYSRYVSEYYGIHIEVTVFVPREEQVVIRSYRVKNTNEYPVEIDVIPLVEYTHFEALKQFTNADWVPQTMMSDKYLDGEFTILNQYAFMKKDTDVNYFTSNRKVSSFETDRRKFLKDNEGGSFSKPIALLKDDLSNYEARRGDNIAALMHKFGEVNSGEEISLITQLGQYTDLEAELKQINKYRSEDAVKEAFDDLKDFWEEHLSVLRVETPCKNFNSMVNIHNPKQCYTTKNWSRYLSLNQLGLGARGIGIRDSSQDIMGVISSKPDEAKELLKTLLSMQKSNGSAYHQYNPKTLEASIGDSHENEDTPDYYGDDHLWLVYATCEYLKETGDYSFLDEIIPFYNTKDIETTVKEHLEKALKFTKYDVGQNGLPHLGFADWNDTVNLPTGAESIFNANLYGVSLKEYIGLLEHLCEDASYYIEDYEKMKSTVNNVMWDGKWYRRYIDNKNNFLGSKDNTEGQIFTNAQSWSVMSGFASEDRGKQALDSVNSLLNTSKGIKLSYPGYNGFDPEKGGVTTYPPGAKENGGIFLHSNPWVMIAETMYGNGDRAYEYYNQINPVSKNDLIDEYEASPYVYPQNILGNEHSQFGLARNTWLSGTASWSYQVASKYIIGVRPTHEGLMIDPCIPKEWSGLEVVRKHKNRVFNIEVTNPDNVSKGVKELIVNGVSIEGNIVPVNGANEYNIKVIMGG